MTSMTTEDWSILTSTPLFGAMPQAAVVSLVGTAKPRHYEKGALLFQQDQPASSFFVILDGWVKVARVSPDGSEAVVGIFRRGETFAEASMFLGGRYPANAEAVVPSRLLRIDGETFRRRIRENPDLSLSMLASASHHLKSLVQHIEQIKLLSAPQRIAEFLLELSDRQEGPVEVTLPYEKSLIAGRLGMKPESFSRAVGKLRAFGVIVNNGQVTIADVARLAAFARNIDEHGEDV